MAPTPAPDPLPPWLQPTLQALLASPPARTHHALLLHGPAGAGQLPLALALARAWLCEAPSPQADGARGACGACPSCHLVDERSHPDLHLVVPQALHAQAGLPLPEAPATRPAKPSRAILIEQVRAALAFSVLTAARGPAKVLLIHPAEAMGEVAANALLKTLEEPPGAMRFILTSQDAPALLATLRSRCRAVGLARPRPEQALAWLQAHGLSEPQALLDATGGQPLRALELARAGLDGPAWLALPQAVARGDAAALAHWPLAELVPALQRLCHDRALARLGLPGRYFAQPGPGASALTLAGLGACARWLGEQARHAEHPWSPALATEALVQSARARLFPSP